MNQHREGYQKKENELMDLMKEMENVEKEYLRFIKVDFPIGVGKAEKLLKETIDFLGSSSTQFQFQIEQYLKGYIRIQGYNVRSVNINYRIPKSRESQESHTTKSFPLENVQRSHHFCEDSISSLKEVRSKDIVKYQVKSIVQKLDRCITPIQNSINQMVLPYEGIYSSFPHLKDVMFQESIRKMQTIFDPNLKREVVLEFSVFEAKLVTSFHQFRLASRKRIGELKGKMKGRFVTVESEKPSSASYLKRSYHSTYQVEFYEKAVKNMVKTINILRRLKNKLEIFATIKEI